MRHKLENVTLQSVVNRVVIPDFVNNHVQVLPGLAGQNCSQIRHLGHLENDDKTGQLTPRSKTNSTILPTVREVRDTRTPIGQMPDLLFNRVAAGGQGIQRMGQVIKQTNRAEKFLPAPFVLERYLVIGEILARVPLIKDVQQFLGWVMHTRILTGLPQSDGVTS